MLELVSLKTLVITKVDQVLMYDSETFAQYDEIPIKLLPTQAREPNEVIGVQKSDDERWLAIVSGKNLVMNEQRQN